MRRVYSQIQITLRTFTLGLAAVWITGVFAISDRDYPVQLPGAVSENVLFVFPMEGKIIRNGGGECGGVGTERPYFCVNHLSTAERQMWIAAHEAERQESEEADAPGR